MLSGNDMGNNTGFRTSTEAGNLKNSHRNKHLQMKSVLL
jgi:hypothetical protein